MFQGERRGGAALHPFSTCQQHETHQLVPTLRRARRTVLPRLRELRRGHVPAVPAAQGAAAHVQWRLHIGHTLASGQVPALRQGGAPVVASMLHPRFWGPPCVFRASERGHARTCDDRADAGGPTVLLRCGCAAMRGGRGAVRGDDRQWRRVRCLRQGGAHAQMLCSVLGCCALLAVPVVARPPRCTCFRHGQFPLTVRSSRMASQPPHCRLANRAVRVPTTRSAAPRARSARHSRAAWAAARIRRWRRGRLRASHV